MAYCISFSFISLYNYTLSSVVRFDMRCDVFGLPISFVIGPWQQKEIIFTDETKKILIGETFVDS